MKTITRGRTMNSRGINNVTTICMIVAIGGLLFGFDTAVISGAVGLLKSQFVLSAAEEGWLVSSGLVGCIIGVLVTGALSNRLGRKKTVICAAVMFFISGAGCALAPGTFLLIAARMIGGVGVGMASVICPMVIAEFAPADQRGKLISYYQLAVTAGILLAYFSNAIFLATVVHEAWRPMFLAMCVPALLFFIFLLRIPESPRWLVAAGKSALAAKILEKLYGEQAAAQQLADLQYHNRQSDGKSVSIQSASLRLPLIIGIVLAVFQQFSGINAIIYYGPSIFQSAGIDSTNSLLFQVIIGLVNLSFTWVAIRWADKYGRKTLLKWGLSGIVLSLIWIGYLFHTAHTSGYLLLILMLIYIACFAFSLGPITWIIINEIFPTAVRVKAVSICTLALWIAVWMVGQFFPWMLEHTGAATTFWLFAFFSLINFVFSWKVVRETSGKTLEEMDEVFISPH